MKHGKIMACSMFAALLLAGNTYAQRVKVAPAPVFYDAALEVTLPADNTFEIKLDGLKAVRAVWMTFAGYPNGKPPRDPQVETSQRYNTPSAACAAARRATGTRNGEQLT